MSEGTLHENNKMLVIRGLVMEIYANSLPDKCITPKGYSREEGDI